MEPPWPKAASRRYGLSAAAAVARAAKIHISFLLFCLLWCRICFAVL